MSNGCGIAKARRATAILLTKAQELTQGQGETIREWGNSKASNVEVKHKLLKMEDGIMKESCHVKSHVRAHVELMWLLSSATPIGWLNRMIQFKEKSCKVGDENVGVALLTYPVLMASDILLYQMVHYREIISDSAYLDRVLEEGVTKAGGIADATLNNVYQAMGFLQR
ncbi:hypothetical protein GH714_031382 [Hevea brasiliensis]|uniref:Uncharacterized protein n=1 Tax=Hevea brasiliensis TaxID=3981 RepID=A0A6A6LVA1_HEVBR|nr:hypothetical protein GH714_031382 [Hevea brasiliensis]